MLFSGCAKEPATPFVPITPQTRTGSPPVDTAIFPSVGSTEFLSANENEQLSAGTGGNYSGNRGVAGNAELDDAAGAAPPSDPNIPTPTNPEPIPDASREIVEGDLFKLEGDNLFVLNRYRGLVIVDVSKPDALRIRGRLPFQSMPVEMYVRDGRAYVVSSDYFQYWQYDPEADPHGFHGSEVLIADVSNPDAPKRMGTLPVDGEITDTRMVGDVLYTVSKRRPDYWRYNTVDWQDTTWIVSLNLADPNDIKEIQRITFDGMSTLIHVAHHAIFVAAWDPNFYLTNPSLEQETLVTYVDISDPSGKLAQRGRVYIPGQIADKFKMDWFDGAFRVLSQRWDASFPTVTLHVVPTSKPDDLSIEASLDLDGVTRAGLQATRFDGERAFAFTSDWISNARKRQLHAIDLSQPLHPKQTDTIEVQTDATHVQVHGDRLLVMGQWYENTTTYQSRAMISLFDVSDLTALVPLSQAKIGEGWSSSGANYDYKAFKTFPDLQLILVPLQYWDYGKSFIGLQLVQWTTDAVTERGRVASTGSVQRAFPVGDRLVAVGDMSITTIDAVDRDKPVVTSGLKLVHNVHDVFDVQGQEVQLVTDVYSGQVRLEVRPFAADDDGPTTATLDLPFLYAPYVMRDGDVLHLIGMEGSYQQVIRNADLTTVTSPKLRGEYTITNEFQTVYYYGWSWYNYYWNPYTGLPLRNQIIPATFRTVVEGPNGRRDWVSKLKFLDLRDVDAPKMAAGEVPMNDYPFINKITHGNVLYSTHVEQGKSAAGTSLLYHVRSYVDRVDVTDPDHPKALPSVNVPGYLVDVSADGGLWYTVDYQWDEFGRRRNSLNVLKPDGDKAVLMSVTPVADQINRAAMRPGQLSENGGAPTGWSDRTIWLTAHKYPWWGVHSDTVASRQPYTVLERLDFSPEGLVASDAKTSLAGYHFDLLDVEGERIYLASNGPTGLLVLDGASLVTPKTLSTARTLSYISRIVAKDQHLYAPLGMFGRQRY